VWFYVEICVTSLLSTVELLNHVTENYFTREANLVKTRVEMSTIVDVAKVNIIELSLGEQKKPKNEI